MRPDVDEGGVLRRLGGQHHERIPVWDDFGELGQLQRQFGIEAMIVQIIVQVAN
jgi:hypothetical protein